MKKILLFLAPLLFLMVYSSFSQCTNGAQFGTITAPTVPGAVTITTCAFGGEYSTINTCSAGSTYQFSATGGTGNFITVRQATPGGAVLGFGFSPITVVCTVSGPLYLHYNVDAACATDGSCHTGFISLILPPCTTPAAQATGLGLTTISTSQINGSFTAAAADGYLVVRYPAGSATTAPVSGTTYTTGNTLGLGKVVSSSALTTFSATGLTPSTNYDFYIYSFNNTACSGGPTYRLTSPTTASQVTAACSPLAAGTYTVGPTGTYASLTAVTTALSGGTTGPVIFELQSTYLSSVETFPITFPAVACTLVGGVIIRPQAGAAGLSITSANTTGTINFNGGSNITFDGRAGGAGASQLTISNTATAGYTVQFINSASFNTIKYCTVSGVNTGTASGVIFFNNAVGLTTGNSNNTIDNCDIKDGATTPQNLIYCSGNITDYASGNNNNTISNSLLHDWFNATSTTASAAIRILQGGSDWTITGNSFYQSATRTFTMTTATDEGAINITSAAFGVNFTITNNFIGGTAALCGGTAWTYTGGATGTPTAKMINLAAALGPLSNISGNTITNFAITSATTNNLSGLISHVSGNANITGNTLGSQTATGAITFTLTNTTSGVFYLPIAFGLGAAPCDVNVSNNNIGGITNNTSSTGATSLRVIYTQAVAGSKITISNNLIGGTVANSIQQNTGTNTAGSGGPLFGILILNPTLGNIITNNTVRNLTVNAPTFSGPSLTGINVQSSGGGHIITGNTVSNLSTNALNIATNNAASIVGISMTATVVGGTNVSGNTISNLTNTNTTVAGWINGMTFATASLTNPPTIVSKNFIHSINLASATGGMAGISSLSTGTSPFEVFNNMIRLGIDANGASITTPLQINGLLKANIGMHAYFNTVYIGGTGVTGAVNSYAYRRTFPGAVDTVMNNIFYNARSNGAGTGKHYAISLNAATALFSNYNDLFANGTGGVLGINNVTDYTTLAAWRTATNQDWNSVSGDPVLVNPTGNTATVDLHIGAGATPIEQAGYNLTNVTDDYDAQARAGLTPVDLGADAGNFTVADVAAPVIYLTTLLTNTCSTGDRALNGINITDATGVPTTGALRPRIYYRKGAGTWFSQPGTLASGTATNGIWNFNIVAADMGGLAGADVVSYYIIAQDIVGTPNIASNFGGAIATDVNTVTTHPTTPNTFTVLGTSLSGTYTVGAGGAYTTLTAAVAAYNTACLGGQVVFSLTDANYAGETFPITINANAFASSTNTLTIKPTVAATTITGSSASGLIVLNGADWVTVDGSVSATVNTVCPVVAASRNLTLTNTNASVTSAVIWLQTTAAFDGASNNRVINLNIVGSGNAQTLIGLGSGSTAISTTSLGSGNNNNAYINNNISKTQYGIFSQGNSIGAKNTGTIINQNLINTVAPNNTARGGIVTGFENGIVISGNNISEIAFTSSPDVFGIACGGISISTSTFTGNEVTNATITKNIIGSVRNTGTFSAAGIFVAPALSGTNLIANNMISGVSANATSGDFSVGMLIGGGAGSTTQVYYNTITMTSVPANTGSTDKSYALAIGGTNPVVDIRNNILFNTQNNGTGNNYAIGYGYTPFTNLTSNNNDYYTATGATFFIGATGSLSAPTNQVTVANLQSVTAKDGAAQNVLPVFVSATDLHLSAAAGVNWCLNNKGVAVSVTDDIDCQVRNNPSDIGADEFTATGTDIATPASQTICSATPITTIVLSGGATSYTWTRDNTISVTGIAASGTGNISGTLTNTTALPVTVTFTITPQDAATCAGPSFTATVTVNPNNTIALTSAPGTNAQTVCINTPITNITYATTTATGATFTGLPAGVTGAWAGNVVTISGTPTVSGPFSYTVTLTGGGPCGTLTANGTITVTPNNTITLTSAAGTNTQSVCLNSPITNITYSTTGATGATFSGLPAGVTGAWAANVVTISGTPTTTVGSPFSYTVTLTGGCGAITATGTITVRPLPVITSTQVEPTTCASADGSINITVTGAAGPYTYAWTGSGVIPGNEDQVNLTVGSFSVTVTAANGCTETASFGLAGPGGCSICPTIPNFATTPSGAACAGTNVTFTASGLTDMGTTYGIIFKYSTVALANPYVGGTVIATVLNGALTGGKTIATANSASVPVGSYFIYSVLTPTPIDPVCRPAAQVSLIIGATPDVNQPANQVVCNSTATAAVNFTGSVAGTVYNWTNSAPSIGLAASGTGDIASFTATNATNAAVVATITVTPQFTTGPITCSGTPKTFTITVNPTPIVNAVTSQTVCNGALTTAVNFTSPTTGPTGSVTFNWSNSNTAIGLGASGTGNIPAFTATNATAVAISGTITVTPVYTGGSVTCTGTPITFTITVNPTPTVNAQTNQIVCAGSTATATFTGAVAGTVYNWTNTNTAIGLGASGTGNISFTATNAGVVPIVGTITVTPTYTNGGTTCTGTPTSFTITVNPTPTVNAIPNQVLCQGQPTAPVNFTGTPAGVVFQWTNNNTLIGLAAAGTGNIPSFITLNPTNVQQVATITVTPVTGLSTPVTTTFAFTGAVQTYTVPAGITSINIKTWGAQGNNNALGVVGGLGGYAEGNLAVTAGQILNVNVGGGATTSINGGFNGGGAAGVNSGCATAQGGGGGGASDVRISPYALANRVIVGAGGGGAGANRVVNCGRGTGGGGGGGLYGGGGGAAWPGVPGSEGPVPTGGTQVAGGAGGITTFSPGPTNGFPGVLAIGGAGGTEIGSAQGGSATAERGGIGGGLTGGSGLYNNVNNWCGQSGAGGSSYIGGVTGGLTTPGLRSGAGQVQITYTPVSATTCFGTPRTFTITVNPNPSIVIIADPGTTICEGDPTLLTVVTGTATPLGVLYTQGTTPVNGSPSQVFEPANTAFNSQSADDFLVPAGATWNITQMTANGIGAGAPTSVNVFFYNNSASNLPGTLITSFNNVTTFTQAGGNYNVTLPSTVSLTGGRYWVSFQVNMSFAAGGQWFWGNFGAPVIGNEYAFQNPGGGFATPCTTWGYAGSGCNVGGGAANVNSIFSLTGTSIVGGGPLPGGYTFLWSPALGLSSTTSNPVAASPQNTTTYTVVATTSAGCTRTGSILITVNKRPVVTTQPVSTAVCAGLTATFTGGATGTGLTYQWQLSTAGCAGPWINLNNATPYSGVTTPTLTVSPVTGLMNGYAYRLVVSGVCAPWIPPTNVSNCAVLTVNPLPVVTITPAGPVCGGVKGLFGTQLSTASVPPPVPGSVTVSSGAINLAVPDGNATGVNHTITVAGVPANATITNVLVSLNMPHTYPADMIFNLKGPSGQILNLYKHNTNTDNGAASIPTAGFYNAVVSGTATTPKFVNVPNPFRYGQTAPAGPYSPDALNGVTNPGYTIMDPTGFVSNATSYTNLFTTATSTNAGWTLAMADGGAGDVGTLSSWTITIEYTTPGTTNSTLSYVWSPLTGLYTDASAIVDYTGTNTPVVYAAPTTLTTYTVTATNTITGCVSTASVLVNYTPPAPTVTPNPVPPICLGDAAVRLTSSSSTSVSSTVTASSGPISVTIPDATGVAAVSTLNIAGVPTGPGAAISEVKVNMNVSHTWVGDVSVNIKAPTGPILNLVGRLDNGAGGNASDDFTNTTFSSLGVNAISGAAAPRTGIFAAEARPLGPIGYVQTVNTWNLLTPTSASANGTWTLALGDFVGTDFGTLTSWSISITSTVTTGVPSSPATWAPITGLFTDPSALPAFAYTGDARDTVWVKRTASGVYTYLVTVQSLPAFLPVPPAFTNPANITITNGGSTPYPSNLVVAGLPTTGVTVQSVSLNGINHTWSDDIDILLQSPAPGNQNVILMSDVGGASIIAAGTTYTFRDGSPAMGTGANPTGTYRPTNLVGTLGIEPDNWPAPGPGTVVQTNPTLSSFTGNMNGTWKLFVVDDFAGDDGSIPGGYTIRFNVPIAPCTSPARTVVVTVNQPTTITTQPVSQTICTDKVATFTVTPAGTGPFSYLWQVSTDNGNTWAPVNNGGVYSGANTATLTITAPPVSYNGYLYRVIVNGAAPCASITSFQVKLTVNPLPSVAIAPIYSALFPGMTTTLTSTVGPFAAAQNGYTWLRDGVALSANSQGVVSGIGTGTLKVDVDGMGLYTLRVTDINGCTGISNPAIVKDSASGRCFIYPNPSSGQFQVRYYSVAGNNNLPRGIVVYDAKGDRVFTQNYTVGRPYDRMDVDMRAFGKGLYWVEVVDRNGNRLTMCRAVIQ